jgi:asparagine synthase (glutamine-hydrolysing)
LWFSMSGIAGIIRFDGASVAAELVDGMTSAMRHRGPDGIQHWVDGSVALGQCMLRTTPESLEERQPLTNEDETLVLVMDGRVDNWEELRRELLGRGAVLRDRSDAELVLRAYEVWGRECLPHIDGDFALAIWDARRREAFCARDRMGHKPFHYHWDGKTLSFASDLRAILALPWVREEPNESMLAEYLTWDWRSRDETLWRGILRLVAAHRMVAAGREPQLECYWEPDLWASLPFRKDEEYFEYYRELLADAIRRLSRSQRPVAVSVSGGLDSSAILCMAEHLRRAGKLLTSCVEGYTLAFAEGDGAAYELPYARAVGEYLGVRIHEIPPTRVPFSWFAECASAERDFPSFPHGTMCIGLHQQAVAQGSRVLLYGRGGDEWMQGSRAYYAEELMQRHWSTVLEVFRSDVAAFGIRQATQWVVRHGCFPLLPPTLQGILRRLVRKMRRNALPSGKYNYWLSPRMREIARMRLGPDNPQPRERIPRAGQQELLEALHHALRVNSMEWTERLNTTNAEIELRFPFDDPKIVQFAFSTPARLWLRGNRTKYIHVQALQGLMPYVILERQTKAEFGVVAREHLGQMQEVFTEMLPCRREGWVNQDGLKRLYQSCRNDPAINQQLWILWTIYGCDGVYSEGCS